MGRTFVARSRGLTVVLMCFLVAIGGMVAAPVPGAAVAAPAADAPDGAHIVRVVMVTPTRATVTVYSPAMRRPVPVTVLLPAGGPRSHSGHAQAAAGQPAPTYPTLYLLDGIDAGVYTHYTESGWTTQTDIVRFMADKPVNVVLPIGGTGSYYTDWISTDPVLGRNKWETFLTEELPPLIDRRFAGNGVDVIGGLSMGALGAMSIAVRHPSLYSGVAAFSGCLDLGSADMRRATAATVQTRGGNPDNMWGPITDADWSAHDPAAHIGVLKGKPIYVTSGNGLPDPALGLAGLASPVGGILESVVHRCTLDFKAQADRAGVPITYHFRAGLHSWGYWNQDMHRAWPTLARALHVS